MNFLAVEDLWERGGSTFNGYIEPSEAAWAMMEEVITPYIEKMRCYHALKMFSEEMVYCMGIISALHEFEHESDNEFKDWPVDAPLSLGEDLLSTWKESCKDPERIQIMEQFMATLAQHKKQ